MYAYYSYLLKTKPEYNNYAVLTVKYLLLGHG